MPLDPEIWFKLRNHVLAFAVTASSPGHIVYVYTPSPLPHKWLDLRLSNVDMSDPQPGKQSKKSNLLRPFKGLFSWRSRSQMSPSRQSDITTASISASPTNDTTSAPQEAQSVTPNNARPSISETNNATTAPQVNPQGTEYTAILELSTTPSPPLTWEHRMKEWGSTAYEGLKTTIQGIYDCSGIFPPLQTTAGVLLTISKIVDVRGSLCSTCKYTNIALFYLSEGFSE